MTTGALLTRLCASLAVELFGTVLEGRHHASDGFVEEHADYFLQQYRAEFEIDEEIDAGAFLTLGDELPMIVEIAEWSFRIADIDAVIDPIGLHDRSEALAKHLE